MPSRRDFVRQVGGAAVAAALPIREVHAIDRWKPADAIKFGYAAITWEGNDQQAIEDISALGFPGIQLRANVLARFGSRPAELRDLLARHRLTFVALSSGNVRIDPAARVQMLEEHASHARFLRDAGGLYLQLIDERPRGRALKPADYQRLGGLLTDIGQRTADLGIPVAYHHHMGSMGQTPEGLERVLDASDPRYVRLLLD
ncbi:MAG TPA: twin-arginine translocation signal domain-containing protein, partial [Gemmatimonadaceae bacterium]|nr:twin-arginine translocation signal domain-containing protein [Gemmatimonadaceae bacterium]